MRIKGSDLRRIIRERLELHLAPSSLDDMGPEEAYGLGYNTGKDFVIQQSDIQGMGAFTDRDFRQGEENCANVMDGNVRRLHTLRDLPVGTEITVDYREQPDLEQPKESWCT